MERGVSHNLEDELLLLKYDFSSGGKESSTIKKGVSHNYTAKIPDASIILMDSLITANPYDQWERRLRTLHFQSVTSEKMGAPEVSFGNLRRIH
jgi:hypothetical protein